MKPRVVLPMIVDECSMQFEDKLVMGLFSALIDRKLTVLKFIPQIKTFRKATHCSVVLHDRVIRFPTTAHKLNSCLLSLNLFA